MGAMANSELAAKIEHVNQRINRLIDIVNQMEGQLHDVSSVLDKFQLHSNGSTTQVLPGLEPKQLPRLSGSTNPDVENLKSLLPLFQSVMEGTQPDPQTLLQSLAALISLRQSPLTRTQGRAAHKEPTRAAGISASTESNSLVIFLILILLLFNMKARQF